MKQLLKQKMEKYRSRHFCDGIGNCRHCGIMLVCEVFADVYRSQRDGIRQVSQYERR